MKSLRETEGSAIEISQSQAALELQQHTIKQRQKQRKKVQQNNTKTPRKIPCPGTSSFPLSTASCWQLSTPLPSSFSKPPAEMMVISGLAPSRESHQRGTSCFQSSTPSLSKPSTLASSQESYPPGTSCFQLSTPIPSSLSNLPTLASIQESHQLGTSCLQLSMPIPPSFSKPPSQMMVMPGLARSRESQLLRGPDSTPEVATDDARRATIADIRNILDSNFQKKSMSSASKDWCNPIPLERKVATIQGF